MTLDMSMRTNIDMMKIMMDILMSMILDMRVVMELKMRIWVVEIEMMEVMRNHVILHGVPKVVERQMGLQEAK